MARESGVSEDLLRPRWRNLWRLTGIVGGRFVGRDGIRFALWLHNQETYIHAKMQHERGLSRRVGASTCESVAATDSSTCGSGPTIQRTSTRERGMQLSVTQATRAKM